MSPDATPTPITKVVFSAFALQGHAFGQLQSPRAAVANAPPGPSPILRLSGIADRRPQTLRCSAMRNQLWWTVGLAAGAANTLRHRARGYRTPRRFSNADYEKAAAYDEKVVNRWEDRSGFGDWSGLRILEVVLDRISVRARYCSPEAPRAISPSICSPLPHPFLQGSTVVWTSTLAILVTSRRISQACRRSTGSTTSLGQQRDA